ncbi:MAG TPA: hypothetical protein VH480_10240 [Streptosporangiaceae bacterium]
MTEPASSLQTDVLRHSERLGRRIRQDPPEQLGVPSQDLAVLALRRGETDLAVSLADYMMEEFGLLSDTVLNGWLSQLTEHLETRLGLPPLLLRVPGTHVWTALHRVALDFQQDAVAAILAGDTGQSALLLGHCRRVMKTINDETVRFIQDILTVLDQRFGEQAPVDAMRGPYESIWRERYRSWEDLTAEEKLQLSCEGMRSHFGGPARDGAFVVRDEGDRYCMEFAACGTGGMLRYGDPETGEGPWPTAGVNRTPQPYTWGKTGVPWYCTHCSLYLEHWPAEDRGYPLRPVRYDDDPASPVSTAWFIYKEPRHARAEDYLRIGRAGRDGRPEAMKGEGEVGGGRHAGDLGGRPPEASTAT